MVREEARGKLTLRQSPLDRDCSVSLSIFHINSSAILSGILEFADERLSLIINFRTGMLVISGNSSYLMLVSAVWIFEVLTHHCGVTGYVQKRC